MRVKVAFLPDCLLVLSLLKHRNCGVKELNSSDPLHTRPKAHAEEEEIPEDEQRESQLPRDIAEDNLVLGQPKS